MRKILATFLAGHCRTPDQYVSEARRRHTLALGQPPPADVEITIKGYVRACKRGIGPSAAKHHFNFEELFPLPLFWTDTSKPGFPIAPVVMILLNGWWVTREIEASAARASHIEVDSTRHTVTWLLPASKQDPYAAGEARTHGCGCRNGVRHPACPYHIFLEYFEVLKQRFGHDFASPERNLPLFPSVNGSTLLKRDVVAAYRVVIAKRAFRLPKWMGKVGSRRGLEDMCAGSSVQSGSFELLRNFISFNCLRDGVRRPSQGMCKIHHCANRQSLRLSPFKRCASRVACLLCASSSTAACGGQPRLASTDCRWKFIERPHARLSLAVALRLPLAQRCEMCWPPLQASSSSSSSSSSGPASTSRSGSQGESEDGASSESVTGMP